MLAIPTPVTLRQPVATSEDYMLLPIEAGFTWAECFEPVDRGDWYLVVFRCKHRADADEALLTQLDADAIAAASETPGLHFYFAGTPRATGECLSFCLWDNQTSARAASAHAAHRKAMEIGVEHYEYYTLERYFIQKRPEGLVFVRLP